MYDSLSNDYDRFVNWSARLALELPFLAGQLKHHGVSSVLDAACGTGMHAIALAQRGYAVAGADLFPEMIARARQNAQAAGVDVRFDAVGFGDLTSTFGDSTFEALLCLGNSLPHLLTPAGIAAALVDFATCLKPGGLLILQNRNFDAVMASRQRWMEPQSHREGQTEWLFLRFYDFDPDGLISFHIVTLRREAEAPWQQHIATTRLRPLLQAELLSALAAAGFTDLRCYGNLSGDPFIPDSSGNLVVVARRP